MAKEPRKTAATKKKSILSRAVTRLKKGVVKNTAARRKSAKVEEAAKVPAKKRRPVLSKGKKKPGVLKKAKDPVIVAVAEDVDTSQVAKFTIETPGAPHKKAPVPDYENLGELPDVYGTRKLYLVARDPHWLYAYWDLTPGQIGDAERQSHDGKVFLQVYAANGERLQQFHVSPWTREWYVGVHRPGQTFYAEVGYYRHDGNFEVITRSPGATAPRGSLSWRTEARFATIPFKFSFRELAEVIRDHALPDEEVAETLARLQITGFPLPFEIGALRHPSDESHRALLDYISGGIARRVRMGSGEAGEISRDSTLPAGPGLSSPFGASFGA